MRTSSIASAHSRSGADRSYGGGTGKVIGLSEVTAYGGDVIAMQRDLCCLNAREFDETQGERNVRPTGSFAPNFSTRLAGWGILAGSVCRPALVRLPV